MRLNVILGNRSERLPRLMNELDTQGITQYEFWDGIYLSSVKEGINAAHRQIVEYAYLMEWPEVAIGEDDLKFFAPGAWNYFLENKPTDYDMYLSSVYMGEIGADNTVSDFCGMGLYIVHNQFYSTFLDTDRFDHIDRSLKGKGKFVVSDPFIAEQWDGYSSNTGKEETYGNLMKNRKKFGM